MGSRNGPSPNLWPMKNSIASLAFILLLIAAAGSSRADVVAESLHANASTLPKFRGQSFTTGPAAQYAGLTFNFYLRQAGLPAYAPANITYYLLSKEFLGRNDQLNPSTPGFIARTTGVVGDQWLFDPSVILRGNTQYWLYGSGVFNADIPGTFAVGSTYAGGQMYFAGVGGGNTWSAESRNDMAFTINCNPLPQTRSLFEVLYETPVIDSGPLSLGLSELPTAPRPTFSLREGTPLGGGSTGYRLRDVISAEFVFGDVIGPNHLTEFYMETNVNGEVDALSYTFKLFDTPTGAGIVIMNGIIIMNGFIGMDGITVTELPFSVTGTDIISGDAFSYTYASAEPAHTVLPVPPPKSLLDVIYDTPVIDSGPLSFGLSELPASPQPTFSLGVGTPRGGGAMGYDLSDVISAELIFGDVIGPNHLTSFNMEVAADGTVELLTYQFALNDTPTVQGPVIINFPFTVTGTDIATGEAFSYTYANSTPTITLAPAPLTLSVLGLVGDTLTLTVGNIPSGETFHLRQSTDLTNFVPLSSPIDITDATPQPLTITVDPATQPALFFAVFPEATPKP